MQKIGLTALERYVNSPVWIGSIRGNLVKDDSLDGSGGFYLDDLFCDVRVESGDFRRVPVDAERYHLVSGDEVTIEINGRGTKRRYRIS